MVLLTEVEGMEEVNGQEFTVKVTGPSTFEIPIDTLASSPYVRGGYLQQIKQPVTHSFLPLSEALVSSPNSSFLLADFGKMERPTLLHLVGTVGGWVGA